MSNGKIKASAKTEITAKTTRMLLRMLRASQPISRIELARRIGVNRSMASEIINPLITANVLNEAPLEISSKQMGRPPMGISFNGSEIFFVGVNLGVRHSQIGLANLDNEILEEIEFETPSKPKAALDLIKKNIRQMYAKFKIKNLEAIGVSVPGPTDAKLKELLYAPHLGWQNVKIADELENYFGGEKVRVVVENDATAAALYEARLRLKNVESGTLKNFLLLRSGTGIGIGLVIEGEAYRGIEKTRGIAGEFGHMTILAGGKLCSCGNRGCWEEYASASAASSLYTGDAVRFAGANPPTFLQIAERAEAGEIRARRTLEKLGEYLGIGIANVIAALGIPHIILSGRLVYGWKYIKEPLFEAVGKSMVGKLADLNIECGEPKGGAIGGALEVAAEDYLMHGINN